MKISLLHPSRSRPERSHNSIKRWFDCVRFKDIETEVIVSVDKDDPLLNGYEMYYQEYHCTPIGSLGFLGTDRYTHNNFTLLCKSNSSCIDAINNAGKIATGDIFIVVSDDTDCFEGWDTALLKELEGKEDFILKTKDGIQDYIITFPVMDRKYYQRTGYIYHPDFEHLFCDTYMTCVADITGRKITSNLLFKHNHYSVGGSTMDEVNKKNDATWKQGEETFLRLMKQFTPEERRKISDPTMRAWLRNKGVV